MTLFEGHPLPCDGGLNQSIADRFRCSFSYHVALTFTDFASALRLLWANVQVVLRLFDGSYHRKLIDHQRSRDYVVFLCI